MKKNAPLILLIIFSSSCTSDKPVKEGLAYIDVTKNYPEKEIFLNDIADITYLYLNSDDDDYLYKGRIHDISKNRIVVYDDFSGSVLFFSRDGSPVSRFNRKGQGPEEYSDARQIIYDETADDVFVLPLGYSNFLHVYSSTGDYKRKISLPEGTIVDLFVSFDDESLFIYDASKEKRKILPDEVDETGLSIDYFDYPFVLISKADGKMLDNVELPASNIVLKDDRVFQGISVVVGRTMRLIKCKEGVLLCHPETDTVFLYNNDRILTPVFYKTPSLKSLNPMVYLNNCVDVGRYQFMEVFTVRYEEGAFPFPAKYYMRDKQTGEIFRQKTVLSDYRGKEFFISPLRSGKDYENGPYFELDLIELKQAYRENKLSGKLKELVATLNEDEDNNVFMLVDFK